MANVIVDYSRLHAQDNSIPPKTGHYSFLAGQNEVHYTNTTLKAAVNAARNWARSNNIFTVILTKAIER